MNELETKRKQIENELPAFWPEWHVVRVLAEGSCGDVYLITSTANGLCFDSALEVIEVTDCNDDVTALIERLRSAPHVVNIEDWHLNKDPEVPDRCRLYVRMELLTSLQDLLSGKGELPESISSRMNGNPEPGMLLSESEVCRLGIEICTALEYCEKAQVIHGDIEPSDLFIDPSGNYKIGGFLAACRAEQKPSHSSPEIDGISYLAPEVFNKKDLNRTADIYSLGLIMYQLLNHCRAAFLPKYPKGYTRADIHTANYWRLRGVDTVPLSNIDAGLDRIVRKACAPDSADRYQSAGEMKAALTGYLNPEAASHAVIPPVSFSEPVTPVREETIAAPAGSGEPPVIDQDATIATSDRGSEPPVIDRDATIATSDRGGEPPVIDQDATIATSDRGGEPPVIDRDATIAVPTDINETSVLDQNQTIASSPYSNGQPMLDQDQTVPASPYSDETIPHYVDGQQHQGLKEPKKKSPLKIILIALAILAAVIAILFLVFKDDILKHDKRGILHKHAWIEATCTEAETCSVCGITQGEPLGHKWKAATCIDPETCSVCGLTQGTALGHEWEEATCTKPKTCSVCGATEGTELGHDWIPATYDDPMTCSRCGETQGNVKGYVSLSELLNGSFSDDVVRIRNSEVHPYLFNNKLVNCRRIRIGLELQDVEGDPYGSQALYVKTNGQWVKVDSIEVDESDKEFVDTFVVDPARDVEGILFLPEDATRDCSWSFNLYFYEAQVEED